MGKHNATKKINAKNIIAAATVGLGFSALIGLAAPASAATGDNNPGTQVVRSVDGNAINVTGGLNSGPSAGTGQVRTGSYGITRDSVKYVPVSHTLNAGHCTLAPKSIMQCG